MRIIDETIGRPTVEEVTGRPAVTYARWAAHHAAKFNATPA
ncbi:hypothetical protein [Streptosporangium roseum]